MVRVASMVCAQCINNASAARCAKRLAFDAISLLLVVVVIALVSGHARPAEANWLTRLAREAGEAGGGAARRAGHALDEMGGLSRHLKALPEDGSSVALAAHVTPEGHWKFANKSGEVYTAANADEMARVVRTLAPDRQGEGPIKLYLSEDSVFNRTVAINDLPAGAELHLMTGKRSYKLRVDPQSAKSDAYLADVKPNLSVRLTDRALFDETIWLLERRLAKSDIRVVSLQPDAAQTLTSAPRIDPDTKAALIDKVDPWKLPAALRSIRGQTVVLTGRIEGEYLYFRPSSGGEKSLLIGDLKAAAREADVNLVILQAPDPLQPGGRNWFWQKIEVKGLNEAVKRADFADFLDALGAQRMPLVVDARPSLEGRIGLDIGPRQSGGAGSGSVPLTDTITNTLSFWTEQVFQQVAGNVATTDIKADLVDQDRQKELDRRIIPGIPFIYQISYLAGLVLGLVGLSYARALWLRLWPAEIAGEYAGRAGYWAARVVRGILFVLVFLPLVGIPVGLWAMLKGLFDQLVFFVLLPFRLLGWLWRKVAPVRN